MKEKKKRNPGKATCLGRPSVVSKVISGGVLRLVQIEEPQVAMRGSFQKMNYFQCFVFMSVKCRIHKPGKPDHRSEDSISHVVWWGLCGLGAIQYFCLFRFSLALNDDRRAPICCFC